MGVPERRQREKKTRCDAILAAARRLFDEKGYEATTVDDIVEACELSKGAFYHHFSSKQEIVGLLQLQNIEKLEAEFAAAAEGVDDPGEQLVSLGRAFVKYLRESLGPNQSLYFLMDSYQIEDFPAELRAQTTAKFQRVFAYIHRAINEGKKRDLFRKDLDAGLLTLAFWGAALGIHAISGKIGGIMPDVDARRISEEFLKMIPPGLSKRTAE